MTNTRDSSLHAVTMKTSEGKDVTVNLANAASFGRGKSFLTPATHSMLVDAGYSTADAVRQRDGSWEIDGTGSAQLVDSFVLSAERMARKVAFLPRQVERKAARRAKLTLESTGQITLCDGTVIRRAGEPG